MAFWKSFTDGGQIGPEFMIKVREMLDVAIRDGPMLNFCKLGHLAVTAVPFAGSGLDRSDIEKVQELQRGILKDEHLPLNRASTEVREELDQLRIEVCDVITKSADEEKVVLEQLLEIVEKAINSSPYSSQQLHPTSPEGSTHLITHSHSDDDAVPHHLAFSQPEIRNRMTSGVVNQIDIRPIPISPVHPRLPYNREPSRGRTLPA